MELSPNSATALAAKGLILAEKASYLEHAEQADPAIYRQAHNVFQRSLELEENATTHQWYSELLAKDGRHAEALEHLHKAIALNPLSASLQRSYSFTLQYLGKIDSAQRVYRRALALEPDLATRLIDSSRLNRYTPSAVAEMSLWHQQNPILFTECSSIRYCEQMAFMYLSIGANDMANEIMANMGPKHFHFRVSLSAISASARGDNEGALQSIENFALWLKDNRTALANYTVAQFRAGKYEQALTTLLQLYPEWESEDSITMLDINADNYRAMVLYAAILSRLDRAKAADALFQYLQLFLKQDRVFDKAEGKFSLAEINAQQGNTQQALTHLEEALQMGWMETYDKEWWSLDNNHLLQPLKDTQGFQQLLEKHEQTRKTLRKMIFPKLPTSTHLG